MFSLTDRLLRIARVQCEDLVRNGGTSAPVRESEFSSEFLVTRNEEQVILLQKLEVDGNVFFVGVPRADI